MGTRCDHSPDGLHYPDKDDDDHCYWCGEASETEKDDVAYLRDLASRLWHIPVQYGVDQGDIERLREIAERLGEGK